MTEHKLQTGSGEFVWCTECGGTNKSLTTDCPGFTMSPDVIDAVVAGTLDYKNGTWVNPKYETYNHQQTYKKVPQVSIEDTRRVGVAKILETIAKDGLPGPRDLDVALDAIFCTIEGK